MQFGANFGLTGLDTFHSILIPACRYAYGDSKLTPLTDMYNVQIIQKFWLVMKMFPLCTFRAKLT